MQVSRIRRKRMEAKFTAKKVNWCGTPGYMVKQIKTPEVVGEQFIPEEVYKAYCKTIGVEPEIIE